MIIKELQEGNYLKYNNDIYKVTTLNNQQDAFGRVKTFITSKDNVTIDITEQGFPFHKLVYLKITDGILNANYPPYYSGSCFINPKECPPEIEDEWELDGSSLYIVKKSGYYILFDAYKREILFSVIIYVHELQNCYKDLTGKDLPLNL